jgi:catalase
MLEPREAIDRIVGIYGAHDHCRALHARGTFYTGTFRASSEAAGMCRAEPFSGVEVPVLVRWSNGAGNPHQSDKAPDVRGMALKLQAGGGDVDLLGQTQPRFPVRTVEDFLDLTAAARQPVRLPWWLARHPGAVPAMVAGVRGKALVPPTSYVEVTYYPVHAYAWVAPDGTRRWVRYVLSPLPGEAPEGTFSGFDRLTQELRARLEAGPVRYDLRATLAAAGDDPHDPMSVWKGEQELSAGIVEVTAAVADPEETGGPVVFDPTRIVDGLELSDDPILLYRPRAYSESIERRTRT